MLLDNEQRTCKRNSLDKLLFRAAALNPTLQHELRLPLMKRLKCSNFLSEEEFNHLFLDGHEFVVDMLPGTFKL